MTEESIEECIDSSCSFLINGRREGKLTLSELYNTDRCVQSNDLGDM